MSTALSPQPQGAQLQAHNRREWIGGSDIAAVCGISPWKSALDVWLEKTGKPMDEKRTAAEEERLYFGKLMEPVILQALEHREGVFIDQRNFRYIHPSYEWARAEIDAEGLDSSGREMNIECKNVSAYGRKSWGEAGSDEAPDYYVAQAQWGMECSDCSYTLAAAFFGGSSLSTFGIERDQDVIGWLFQTAEKFWTGNVLRDIPPDPRTKEDAARMLAKMPGFRWKPSETVRQDVTLLQSLKQQRRALEAQMNAVEARVVCSFTAAELVQQDEDGKYSMTDEAGRTIATWNRQTRKGYTVPDATYHTLRIKGEK